jgi:RimJ/RimL family protein N-acetyltransferase
VREKQIYYNPYRPPINYPPDGSGCLPSAVGKMVEGLIMNIVADRMQEYDLAQVMKIQSDNLREHLTPSHQKDGYLSIAFTEAEFRAFNLNLGVIVARTHHEVIGYSCISDVEFNTQFPILDQIVKNIPFYSIPGTNFKPSEGTSYFHGPICIARSYRGKGVIKELFSKELEIAKEKGYAYCFSFISSENKRSLKAHAKLSFQKVGTVIYNDKEYIVIACNI